MWQGVLYDGCTAAGTPVIIEIWSDGLVLAAEGARWRWPFAELSLAQGRRQGEPVRLARGEASLVVNGTGFLAALPAEARRRLIRQPAGRRLVPLVAAIMALLLAGAGAALFFLPPLVDLLVERIPPAWEERLGDQVAARFFAGFEMCGEPAANQAAAEIMARLETAIPDTPYPLRVTIVKDGMANAFALPGGRIVVMGGLLAATASPEELAGVLAHETAHIVRRHATRAMLKTATTSLLLQLLFGNDNLGGMAAGGLQTLAQLRYSRENELEADRHGLELLRAAGIDPRAMVRFFAQLDPPEQGAAVPAYLSTHPATADRIHALEQALASRPPESGHPFLIGQGEWAALNGSCR